MLALYFVTVKNSNASVRIDYTIYEYCKGSVHTATHGDTKYKKEEENPPETSWYARILKLKI